LFFTGTALGIAPIARVDHRQVGNGATGAVTSHLRRLYFDATHGHLRSYLKWLTPVYKSRKIHEQDANPLVGMHAG
jgi:hypothetical protein